MKTKLGTNDVLLTWRHHVPTMIRGRETESTVCFLLDPETKNVVSKGDAILAPQDNYSKSTGRKYSLKRALQNLELTKEARKAVWESYLSR